jgi:hypothetical protein
MVESGTGIDSMELTINGKQVPVETGDITTFKELMDRVQSEHVGFPNVITRVFLNEQEIDHGQEIGLGAFPVDDVESLKLMTADRLELAYEAMRDSQVYLPELSAVLEDAARAIRGGDVSTGLKAASEALEYISQFGEVLNGIRTVFQIDFAQVRIDDVTLLDKLLQLNTHASDVLKAIHDENWSHFADLIEYEISPLLYEWMAVIPELVKLLPDRLDGEVAEENT